MINYQLCGCGGADKVTDEQQQYSVQTKRRDDLLPPAPFLPLLRQETTATIANYQPRILVAYACHGGDGATIHGEGASGQTQIRIESWMWIVSPR